MTWGTPGTLELNEVRDQRRARLWRAAPFIALAVFAAAIGVYEFFER